jgi:hypothetical protein
VHHIDPQCRVDRSSVQAVRGALQRPAGETLAATVLSGGCYAWTGGAREAVGEDVRALKDAGLSVATEATTSTGTRPTTRCVSAALAIEVTRITTLSWSLSSQNPAIHVGSRGLAWATGQSARSATTSGVVVQRRQLIGVGNILLKASQPRVPSRAALRNIFVTLQFIRSSETAGVIGSSLTPITSRFRQTA